VNRMVSLISVCCSLIVALSQLPTAVASAEERSPSIREHADQSFQEMKQSELSGKAPIGAKARTTVADTSGHFPSDQYLIGKGHGDLSKGKSVCLRVSELSARTDLAKQIRVMVKEHMVDRVRERSGKDAEQDIELTREEIVQEYLQGVKIVDRQIDEENKSCSATAVMPKSQIAPKSVPDQLEPVSTIIR
jgi:LPP20 lipoprotein